MTKTPKQKYKIGYGGHRGNGQTDYPSLNFNEYVGKYPENTLLSIEYAIKSAAADFIEIDVVLSKDGIPMVTHSNDLRQHVFTQTLPEDKYFASQYTAKELQAMRVGRRESYDTTMPSLAEVMEAVARHNRVSKSLGRPAVELNIELKGVQGTDAPRHQTPNLAEAVKKAIEASELQPEHIILSSFAETYLKEARRVMPDIRRGMLFTSFADAEKENPIFPGDPSDPSKYEKFTPKRVKELHSALQLSAVHPEITSLVKKKEAPKEARKKVKKVKTILQMLVTDKELQSPQGKKLEVNSWFLNEKRNDDNDRTMMSAISRVSKQGLSMSIITNHVQRTRMQVNTLLKHLSSFDIDDDQPNPPASVNQR